MIEKADLAHGTLSETVLHNVRIVAIDQEIVQGGPANNATAGKVAHTVSLQLAPEQVKKITVAEQLGKLSLAVRSAVEQQDTGDSGHNGGRFIAGNTGQEDTAVRETRYREHGY